MFHYLGIKSGDAPRVSRQTDRHRAGSIKDDSAWNWSYGGPLPAIVARSCAASLPPGSSYSHFPSRRCMMDDSPSTRLRLASGFYPRELKDAKRAPSQHTRYPLPLDFFFLLFPELLPCQSDPYHPVGIPIRPNPPRCQTRSLCSVVCSSGLVGSPSVLILIPAESARWAAPYLLLLILSFPHSPGLSFDSSGIFLCSFLSVSPSLPVHLDPRT